MHQTGFKKLLWCGRESNPRHKDFQSFALPTELPHHLLRSANVKIKSIYANNCFILN